MFLALLAPLVYMSCTVHDMYTNGASQVCVCVCVCVRACMWAVSQKNKLHPNRIMTARYT